MQEYQMIRDTQLRLDKCNIDEGKTVITQYEGKTVITQYEGKTVITQYEGENIVMQQSTRTQEDGMQRKDLGMMWKT